jgi:septal ring-binding cell division protein DamX
MKKAITLIAFILLILMSCSKTEKIPGYVGSPVYLAPVIQSADDTLACTYSWSFINKPNGSNMNILSLQPNSRSFNIYFVPDVTGEYTIGYTIVGPDGKEKTHQEMICEIIEDTVSAIPGQQDDYTLTPEAQNAPLPIYEDSTPTIPVYTTSPPKQKPQEQTIPKVSGNYTIQISSWKTYAGAERAISKLATLDLDLYIQKAHFSETGETWYRVRTGTFDTYAAARQTMNKLKTKLPGEKIWIDFIRDDQQ